ncbi:unnamed protein product [Ectocarpus sp. 8 AP-2014]
MLTEIEGQGQQKNLFREERSHQIVFGATSSATATEAT